MWHVSHKSLCDAKALRPKRELQLASQHSIIIRCLFLFWPNEPFLNILSNCPKKRFRKPLRSITRFWPSSCRNHALHVKVFRYPLDFGDFPKWLCRCYKFLSGSKLDRYFPICSDVFRYRCTGRWFGIFVEDVISINFNDKRGTVHVDQNIWDFKKLLWVLVSTGHDVANCSPICGLRTLPRIIITLDESSLIITNDHGSPQIITDRH